VSYAVHALIRDRSAWPHPIRIGVVREENLIKRINTRERERTRKTRRMIRTQRQAGRDDRRISKGVSRRWQ
jgi:hypothetical protein